MGPLSPCGTPLPPASGAPWSLLPPRQGLTPTLQPGDTAGGKSGGDRRPSPHLSFSHSHPVSTAWEGAARPRGLGDTPGPTDPPSRYGTPPTPAPWHLQLPRPPALPVSPSHPTPGSSHGSSASPGERPAGDACPANPVSRGFSKPLGPSRPFHLLEASLLPDLQHRPTGTEAHLAGSTLATAPHVPGTEQGMRAMGSAWRVPQRVPPPQHGSSYPHRASEGSLWLLLRPLGLPHPVGQHHAACTSCCTTQPRPWGPGR